MRFYDLSMPLDPTSGDPLPPKIHYVDHDQNIPTFARLFGVTPEEIPDGKASAVETVTSRTHCGTHCDAPWHFFPTSEGRPARRIDELPLDWFFSDGVVLDFHDRPSGYEITVADVQPELRRIGYTLKPRDIVLIRTDASKRYWQPDFPHQNPGMGPEATRWLIDQGVKVMGIDAWAWDVPLRLQAERYRREGRREVMWAAHRVAKEREYVHLEQLGNLDQLPRPFGFKVSVFPIKVAKGSAGWVRAVAIFAD